MKNSRLAYMLTAILSLFNVLFLPIYAVPDWAAAQTGTALGFYNAVQILLYVPHPLEYWIVSMTLAIFIPSFALFITALIGKQTPYLISALGGITLWTVAGWSYMQQFEFARLFVLDGSGIGIGFWCAIVLLILATFFALRRKNKN